MPNDGPFKDYVTTQEMAHLLGLHPASIRDAVMRGRIAVVAVAGRNVIHRDEVQRYEAEIKNTKGWATRRAPDYTPDTTRAEYLRQWRQRRRDQAVQQGPEASIDIANTEREV